MTGWVTAPGPKLDQERLSSFVARQYEGAHNVHLDLHLLRGGLTAALVARARAHFLDAQNRPRTTSFVVKCLAGDDRREAAIYEAVLAPAGIVLAPRLLEIERLGPSACYLYLEHVRPCRRWPWVESVQAGRVLDQLAKLHASAPIASFSGSAPNWDDAWDYEAQLQQSAHLTLDIFERTARQEDFRGFRRALPGLRRIVSALPAIRRVLVAAEAPGVVIHGDAHPGNALIRLQGGSERAILLDWGRARVGSSLEDVSSWLKSLGCWEPEARRRHDTLLRRYLFARGLSTHLGHEVRDAYWLAGACNVLAGALRYHLAILNGWGNPSPRARSDAARIVRDYSRVIRRADAVWRH